jgi:hypothetical protein
LVEKLWKNNCLFVGLSAAFAEPLEATSIHSTIVQLHYFIFNYLKNDAASTCNQGSIQSYNNLLGKLYDGFRDFLSAHYSGKRTDSEFWRDITKPEKRTEKASILIESVKDRSIIDSDFDILFGYAGSGLWNWTLAGLGHITRDSAVAQLKQYAQEYEGSETYHQHINRMAYDSMNNIDNTTFVSLLRSKEI